MNHYLEIAKQAARAAGDIQRNKYGRVESVEYKGAINLVTEVDLACEATIIETILSQCPDHQILAEESGLAETSSPYKWIIDPLDGTTNYAHGYPCFAVSIALEHAGEVQMGVIYDPMLDELFEARKGQGAFLNGQQIRVSQTPETKRALLATGFAYDVHEASDDNLDHFADFIKCSQAVRRDGAAAIDLAYVACGRYDGFWELSLWPWDVAVGSLLVTEAGGQMSLFDGSPMDIYAKQIVASNGIIHDDMIRTLNQKRSGPVHD